MAMAYHDEGECTFCDTLRGLIREANAEDDK
jgi:hypothetical protein